MVEFGMVEQVEGFHPNEQKWLALRPQSPIRVEEIPRFVTLVNWHPLEPGYGHYGYDIAAYIARTESGLEVVIGLPKGLPVYAVAMGTIDEVKNNFPEPADYYHRQITIRHNRPGLRNIFARPLYSDYWHVSPEVVVGQRVKTGQRIGRLYFDTEHGDEEGRLVHLHILTRYGRSLLDYADPEVVIPGLNSPKCILSQEISDFQVEGYGKLPIRIANYRVLEIRKTEGR